MHSFSSHTQYLTHTLIYTPSPSVSLSIPLSPFVRYSVKTLRAAFNQKLQAERSAGPKLGLKVNYPHFVQG